MLCMEPIIGRSSAVSVLMILFVALINVFSTTILKKNITQSPTSRQHLHSSVNSLRPKTALGPCKPLGNQTSVCTASTVPAGRWPTSGQLSSAGAIIGGFDHRQQTAFVCRAKHRNEFLPGQLIDDKCTVLIATQKVIHFNSKYQVLMKPPNGQYRWRSVRRPVKHLPNNVILGGGSRTDGFHYVGRCRIFDSKKAKLIQPVGRITWHRPSSQWISRVPVDDQSVECFDFEVLIHDVHDVV